MNFGCAFFVLERTGGTPKAYKNDKFWFKSDYKNHRTKHGANAIS
jgi:uncharacterized protein YutD